MEALTTSQVDRLGKRLAEAAKPSPDDLRMLSQFRHQFGPALDRVLVEVRGCPMLPSGFVLTTRPEKTTGAIVAKLRREHTRLSRMREVAGCRLVVERRVQQEAVVADLWSPHPDWEGIDRRTDPRYGYRAIHLVATDVGGLVEVQVRTQLQQVWADLSESLERVFPGVKYGEAPAAVHETLRRFSDRIWALEAADTGEGRLWRDEHELATLIQGMLRPEEPHA